MKIHMIVPEEKLQLTHDRGTQCKHPVEICHQFLCTIFQITFEFDTFCSRSRLEANIYRLQAH